MSHTPEDDEKVLPGFKADTAVEVLEVEQTAEYQEYCQLEEVFQGERLRKLTVSHTHRRC